MTQTPSILVALLAAAVLLGPTGCRSANTFETTPDRSQVTEAHLSRIITDTGVNKRAMVESVYVSNETGLTRVQVNVINKNAGAPLLRPKQHAFRYKFEWFDGFGMKVTNPNESWKRKMIEAREFTSFTATAPSPDAVDWRLSVHRSKGH